MIASSAVESLRWRPTERQLSILGRITTCRWVLGLESRLRLVRVVSVGSEVQCYSVGGEKIESRSGSCFVMVYPREVAGVLSVGQVRLVMMPKRGSPLAAWSMRTSGLWVRRKIIGSSGAIRRNPSGVCWPPSSDAKCLERVGDSR